MAAQPFTSQAADTRAGKEEPDDVAAAVPVRHRWRWISVVVLAVLAAQFVHGIAFNPRLNWTVIGRYLFDERVLAGLRTTLVLTVLSMVIATVLGVALAIMRLSSDPVLRSLAALYVLVFRSVPLLVQLLFWYFLAAVMPTIGLGIPFGPEFITFDSNRLITQFAAALLGLGLAEAAYIAEYVRGGIMAVPKGQVEAAMAVGLRSSRILRRIVLPQAIRVIIPAYGNTWISQIKATAGVIVIGVGDLLTQAQFIYQQNLQQIPLLTVVTIWYLAIVLVLTGVQRQIERRSQRGYGTVSNGRRSRGRTIQPIGEGS
jgi:polar amino acid transport system permease protein